jgi:hypothetical protein
MVAQTKDFKYFKKYLITALLSVLSMPCFAEAPGFYTGVLLGLLLVIIILTIVVGALLRHFLPRFNINWPGWVIFLCTFY